MVRAYRRAQPTAQTRELPGWLARLSQADRNRFRAIGMQLVGDLVTYLDVEDDHELLLAAAEERAGQYGAEAVRAGASLSETVEGFLRFRKPFVDELAVLSRRRHLDTREATDLLAQAESALDRLLVALMLGYKAATGST